MKNVTILRVAMPLAVVAMLAVTAQAAPTPTVYEGFDYYPDTQLDQWNIYWGGYGFSSNQYYGAWSHPSATPVALRTTDNTSLLYPTGSPLVGVGTRVESPSDESEANRRSVRELETYIDTGADNTFYMSALVQKNYYGHSYAFENIAVGLCDEHDKSEPTNPWDPDNPANYCPPAGVRFGLIGSTNPSGGDSAFFVQMTRDDMVIVGTATVNQTYLLAVKVVTVASGDDKAYMKVYDASATDLSEPMVDGDWDAISSADIAEVLGWLHIRHKYCPGQVDEFLLGDSWEDVTGVGGGPIPGDANLDDVVNDSDLNLLLSGWYSGATPGTTWGEGDFNGDLVVNDSDLNLLLSNWNYPPAGSVPEPATIGLLAFGAIALVRRRRRA